MILKSIMLSEEARLKGIQTEWVHVYDILEKAKLQEMENRLVVPRRW